MNSAQPRFQKIIQLVVKSKYAIHDLSRIQAQKKGEKAKGWNGVDRILRKGEVKTVPEAAVAVFMGKEFDSFQGRGAPRLLVPRNPFLNLRNLG